MRTIKISDVTLQQETEAFSLSFREKIEISRLLDSLGVDVIELSGIVNAHTDALLIKSIAAAVTNSTLAVPVTFDEENIRQVSLALKEAKHPRLQVCAAVSSVQMEYLYHKKADAMLSCVADTVKLCRTLCPDVEFVAGDATRADPAFLADILRTAIEAGAGTVTVRNTAGTDLPEEFGAFLRDLRQSVPQLAQTSFGVSCGNALHLADAAAICAVSAGATEIKTAAFPVDISDLSHVASIVTARQDTLDVCCNISVPRLRHTVEKIEWMCRTDRKKTSPFDTGVRQEDPGIFLTARDDIDTVLSAVSQLGYELSEEDRPKVYEAFCKIAEKKEKVGIRELDAIVASAAMQVPDAYCLDSYVINAGNTISATAHIRLRRGENMLEGVCIGGGPIDAAFLAIEQITGRHYELDDFQIQAVTEGREAMGQTIVRLRAGGKLYAGRGISTDIVGAGINAYISALNKIVYEEDAL